MTMTTTATTHWTATDPDARWTSSARDVAQEIGTHTAEHDRMGDFVTDAFERLRAEGFLSMLVPTELGGGGASHAEACAALAALAHGCPATALTLSMHTHLVGAQVWRHHHDLPAPLLARVATEQLVLVSTGASDWIDSNGTATQVDDGFRVTARKAPASGSPVGDLLVTSVRWEGAPDGPQVIHFAVPFGAAGVRVEQTWDAMGMRATGSHTVVLDDVFVPTAAVSLTRPAGVWHPVWNIIVGTAMPLIMAVYTGVAEAAADRAIAVAAARADVTTVPLIGRMLNRLHACQDAVGAMVAMSADLHFAHTTEHASAVLSRKTTATEAAIDTVRLAMELTGGAGYSRSTGIERLYRDVHGALYHPLPAAKQELFSGRVALGAMP
jgi:acyl-CoA dehydrogenase